MIAARLQAHTPNGAPLGEMPYPLTVDPMVAHNDVGALSFSYSDLAAGGSHLATALQSGLEVALEISKGEKDSLGRDIWVEPKGCRFVRLEDDSDPSDPTKRVNLTLPSFGWLLGKCVVGAAGAIDGRRVFTAPTVGSILLTLMSENASRGGYATSFATPFTETTDSAGTSWPVLPDQAFEVGTDYLTVLDALTAAGACDWMTQARGLYCYTPDAVALSPDLSVTGGVVLNLGTDVGGAPTKRSIANMSGRVLVLAEAGGVTMAEEPTATTGWGIPESTLRIGQVSGEPAGIAAGQAHLEQVGRPQGQFTRELILAAANQVPLLDYWPGCWIKAPGAAGVGEKLRVQQATLSFQGVASSGSLTLNDVLLESDERRARTLASLAGGTISPGGPAAPIAVDPEASRVPSTPTGLDTVASVVFQGPTPRGVVTASWNAVTTATDSGALAISGYELQWRVGAGAWQAIRTAEVSAQIGNLTPGDSIETRVRAVGARTTLPSAWSMSDTVVVPGDVTPPPVPTGLTVTSSRGVVIVTWAGTPAMPADFSHVEVYFGDTDTPTTVAGRMAGKYSLPITDQPRGATRYARLRSFDTTGNASAYTAAVSVVVSSIIAGELDQSISDAIDEALTGSVDGNRLEPWTVPGNRVLVASVTNIHPDPHFEGGSAWSNFGWLQPAGTGKDGSGSYLIPAGTTQRGGYFGLGDVPRYGVPVKAGATLRLNAWVHSPTEIGPERAVLYMRFYALGFPGFTAIGTALNTATIPADTWGEFDGTVTVPSDLGDNVVAIFGCYAQPLHTDTLRFSLPRARVMAGAKLVVDGELEARHMKAQTLTFDSGVFGSLDGIVLTASVQRTAASGARVEMNPDGLFAYNASGTQTISIVGGTASITGGTITGANVRTAATGGQARMGNLVGGGGFWTNDSSGVARASMQVSDTVSPGLYLWDAAGTTRVYLYTTGTQSVMSFRSPAATEVMKITDGQITIYAGGRFAAEHPNGEVALQAGPVGAASWGLLVNKDNGNPVMRVYQTSGDSGSVYVGHENQNIVNMQVWSSSVWFGKNDAIPGAGSVMDQFVINSDVFYLYNAGGTLIHGWRQSGSTRLALGDSNDPLANLWMYASVTQIHNHSSMWFIDGSNATTGIISRAGAGALSVAGGNGAALVLGAGANFTSANGNTVTLDNTNLRSAIVYSNTTTGDANVVVVTTSGVLMRSTSLRAAKIDVEDAPAEWADVALALRPRTWLDRGNVERYADALTAQDEGELVDWEHAPILRIDDRTPGFVAEEVIAAGGDVFITRDETGAPSGLAYARLTAALVALAQRQQQQIDSLTTRITTLEEDNT